MYECGFVIVEPIDTVMGQSPVESTQSNVVTNILVSWILTSEHDVGVQVVLGLVQILRNARI